MAADPFQAEDEQERAEQECAHEIEVQKILQKLRDTLLDMVGARSDLPLKYRIPDNSIDESTEACTGTTTTTDAPISCCSQ